MFGIVTLRNIPFFYYFASYPQLIYYAHPPKLYHNNMSKTIFFDASVHKKQNDTEISSFIHQVIPKEKIRKSDSHSK